MYLLQGGVRIKFSSLWKNDMVSNMQWTTMNFLKRRRKNICIMEYILRLDLNSLIIYGLLITISSLNISQISNLNIDTPVKSICIIRIFS